MSLFMITQSNFFKHEISEWPFTEQKPLSGMHIGVSKGLKDDNTNIPIANWLLVNTTMCVPAILDCIALMLLKRGLGIVVNTRLHCHMGRRR